MLQPSTMAQIMGAGRLGGGGWMAANRALNQPLRMAADDPSQVAAAHAQFSALTDPVQQGQWLQQNPAMRSAMVGAGLLSNEQINNLTMGNNQGTLYNTPANAALNFSPTGAIAMPQRQNVGAGLHTGASLTDSFGPAWDPSMNAGRVPQYNASGQIVDSMGNPVADMSGAPAATATPPFGPGAFGPPPPAVPAGGSAAAFPGGGEGNQVPPTLGTDTNAIGPVNGGSTLAQIMGGTGGAATTPTSYFGTGATGSITNPNIPNYPLNIGAYLDPSMKFTMDQGLRALQSSASAGGNLLSGNTLKDIVNYSQGLAGTNWNNAAGLAQGQQQFGYGVNAADRNFAQQQALIDQTVPFQQQLSLAQLGLQGAQGQQSGQNLLATLLAQLSQAGGQAAGTGTIGGSNAITGALGQAIANLLGQTTLSQIMNRGTGAP